MTVPEVARLQEGLSFAASDDLDLRQVLGDNNREEIVAWMEGICRLSLETSAEDEQDATAALNSLLGKGIVLGYALALLDAREGRQPRT